MLVAGSAIFARDDSGQADQAKTEQNAREFLALAHAAAVPA
jgi:hypothetical protein